MTVGFGWVFFCIMNMCYSLNPASARNAEVSSCQFPKLCPVPDFCFSSDDWQFYITYFDSVFQLIDESWTPPPEEEQ